MIFGVNTRSLCLAESIMNKDTPDAAASDSKGLKMLLEAARRQFTAGKNAAL